MMDVHGLLLFGCYVIDRFRFLFSMTYKPSISNVKVIVFEERNQPRMLKELALLVALLAFVADARPYLNEEVHTNLGVQ